MTQESRGTVGDYELLELIGSGAQGQVYRARRAPATGPNIAPAGDVALKILACTGIDQTVSAQIERSSGILRSLSHRNIVKYLDSFSWRRESDETRCLVTEFLEGETLDKRLQQYPGGLPWKKARDIFAQCAEGLIHAREQGVVHRDLKPSNIFVLKDETVKLIDFDIARWDDATTTGSKGWIGSFDYMAPDFARLNGFRGDELSDVFSLGTCFYQALTGKLPFKKLGADADVEYLHRWRTGREPELSFQSPVFRVLERSAVEFFRRAIEPDRSKRFQTFALMLDALRSIRSRTVTGNDTYELDELLGHGGFGEVFLAKCARDDRQVAIKRLFSDQQSRRFIKEAKLLQSLHHEHLVEYVDFVDIKDAADSHNYFLVMELLAGMPGWTLRNRIRDSGTGIGLTECLEIFSHYLECLQYLHDRKIIHRDIKPANLYAPAGNPAGAKLFDLGIARDLSGTATAGFVPGTLEYMPPELAREGGGRGSPRSDIYSTGLSLYEALTGKPAYMRLPSDERQAFQQFLQRESPPGEKVNYDLPVFIRHPGLADIIRKAVHVRPKDRYPGAEDMRREIEAIRAELRLAAERTTADRAVRPDETAATLPVDSGTAEGPERSARSDLPASAQLRKNLLTAGLVAAAMILAIAIGVRLTSVFLIPGPRPAALSKPIAGTNSLIASVAAHPQNSATNLPPEPAVITNSAPPPLSPDDRGADELSILALAIDGETSALLEFFALPMAESIALEHKRAEAISARLSMSSAPAAPEDRMRLQSGMDRLVLAATNRVGLLAGRDDIAGLRDWPRVAPTLASIPAVRLALEKATAGVEANRASLDWLERRVAIEAAIAELSATNAAAGMRRLGQEFSTLAHDAGGDEEKSNQVVSIAERISIRFGTIAGELCGAANDAYANDNLKDGDENRREAESFRNLVPDPFKRNSMDRLLASCSAERNKTVRRLAAAEQDRLAMAARAEQAMKRGVRLELRTLPDNPPLTIAYRRSGAATWEDLRISNPPAILQPGNYSFRFVRPDYEVAESEAVVAPGAENAAAPIPAKWNEKDQLALLRKVEKAMSSEPKDMSILDAVFNSPPPAFEWTGHAARFQDLCSQWNTLSRARVAAAADAAELAVSGYVLWLYQVYDPVIGSYKRYKVPVPQVSFDLPSPNAGTNTGNELSAQLRRLNAWRNAGGSLQSDTGQTALATSLTQYAAELEAVSARQSAKCRFEAALLLARPGEANAAMEQIKVPEEAARWRAHARYAPRTSALDTLRNLADYAGGSGSMDSFDMRLAVYAAFYTWRNAVAGERQYALEVNTALGAILNGLDGRASGEVVAFLAGPILRDGGTAQDGEPCLYMMNALSFMPGLAHGSELKRQAASWLGSHGADPIVLRKEAAIRESLDLLKTLLRPDEQPDAVISNSASIQTESGSTAP